MHIRALVSITSCIVLFSSLLGCSSDDEDDTAGAGATGAAASNGSGAASSTGAGGDASGSGGAASSSGGSAGSGGTGGAASGMSFFVSSDTRPDGNFGGLEGADARCQMLAEAVGEGGKTWRAYLSTEDPPVHARDRIGEGPYINAAGIVLAADKAALHTLQGDAELFLTETGAKVNGQWDQSPDPNEHDIMTGTTPEGMVDPGSTCADWTSNDGPVRVGHSDGLGPGGSSEPQYVSWNSSHDGQCGDPEATGGAGKIYCFVGP